MWLDPGLTTGWALLAAGMFSSGQEDFAHMGMLLEALAEQHGEKLAIGWEQYIVTPGGGVTGTANPPIETIGMAKWIAQWHECQVLKEVPSSFRIVAQPHMLKKLGWYKPGQDHANQATRHLMAWMLREKLMPMELYTALFVG
jgi:hypothetical protein